MVQRRPTGHHRELLVKRLGRFRQAVGLCLLGGHPPLQLSDGSRLESRGPALGRQSRYLLADLCSTQVMFLPAGLGRKLLETCRPSPLCQAQRGICRNAGALRKLTMSLTEYMERFNEQANCRKGTFLPHPDHRGHCGGVGRSSSFAGELCRIRVECPDGD